MVLPGRTIAVHRGARSLNRSTERLYRRELGFAAAFFSIARAPLRIPNMP
jgi:hypothetical protein